MLDHVLPVICVLTQGSVSSQINSETSSTQQLAELKQEVKCAIFVQGPGYFDLFSLLFCAYHISSWMTILVLVCANELKHHFQKV